MIGCLATPNFFLFWKLEKRIKLFYNKYRKLRAPSATTIIWNNLVNYQPDNNTPCFLVSTNNNVQKEKEL